MAQQTIVTTSVGHDSLKSAGDKINANFTEVYALQTTLDKKGTLLVFGGSVSPGLTRYAVHGTADSTVRTNNYEGQIPVSAGTVKNLRVWICANVGVTSYAVTVQKNGVDTGITVDCTSNAATGTLYADLTHSTTTASGDRIGIKIVTGVNGGFTPGFVYYTVELIQ